MYNRHSIQYFRKLRAARGYTLLFALLLVCAQWLVLDHRSELLAHSGVEVCDICLVWHASDDLLLADIASLPRPALLQTPVAERSEAPPQTPHIRSFARGPPPNLS